MPPTPTSTTDPIHRTLPPQLAGLIVSVLEERGFAPGDVLAGTGLGPAQLADVDRWISLEKMLAVIERAIALSKLPELGLVVGARENLGTWGALGYAVMSCATEREAFDVGLRFQNAASTLLSISATEDDGRMRLQLDAPIPLGPLLPFCVEEMVAGICTVGSVYMNRPVRPLDLSLSYARPAHAEAYTRMFGCKPRFDQAQNVFWTDIPGDRALKHADPASAAMSLRLVEDLLASHDEADDLIVRTRKALLRTPGRLADMEAVSRELGMTSRTLRRKLDALGTSFRCILDDVRSNLAKDYLAQSELTIDEIASFLGYTETTNFRRAFKKWTGSPPSAFRPR